MIRVSVGQYGIGHDGNLRETEQGPEREDHRHGSFSGGHPGYEDDGDGLDQEGRQAKGDEGADMPDARRDPVPRQ